jgi:hypothetical protein
LNITKYKEREQEHDLDLNTKMPKYMANAFFYRPKFETIDLMNNCWVGAHILTWWQSLSCLNKTSLLTSEFESTLLMKVLGNCLSFPGKKIEIIWTSRTRDMGWTQNIVWVAGQILTSLLLLRFGLPNSKIGSCAPRECFRSMSRFPSI